MRSLSAVARGVGRALGSPKILVWLWLANLAVALPAAVWIGESIRSSVSHRLAADELRRGFDFGWHGEYLSEAEGVEKSLQPTLLGVGAFLRNLNDWLGLEIFEASPALVVLGAAYALIWLLLLGGVLEHFVRPAPGLTLDRFLANGARRFFAMLRLTVLSAPLYWAIHRLSSELFPWIEQRTRDLTSERGVLMCYLAGALAIAGAAVVVKLVFDYARVALVVEERRSVLFALARGLRFVVTRPLPTLGLVFWLGLLSAVGLFAYSLVAPGAGVDDPRGLIGAMLIGQAFLLVRGIFRLAWIGGEVALYRDSQRLLPPSL
jgi:hypothetical protein